MALCLCKQCSVIDVEAGSNSHDGDHLGSPSVTGAPGDDAVVHAWVCLQRRFDFLGKYFLTARVDGDGIAAVEFDGEIVRVVVVEPGTVAGRGRRVSSVGMEPTMRFPSRT